MERRGRQTPTASVVLPYTKTLSEEVIEKYNSTGKSFMEWQGLLLSDIMAVNDDNIWVHDTYGFEIPRQNGKGEVLLLRSFYGLTHGEKVLYSAHRTTTSRAAWERLMELLDDLNIKYKESGALGQEKLRIYESWSDTDPNKRKLAPGAVHYRTRTAKGGVGESFDCLIIDEAQEYTDSQQSALQYTIAASENPQIIYTGTPPTADSVGTVFPRLRKKILSGAAKNSGWAEWSIDTFSKMDDKAAWYETNPSLGIRMTERTIEREGTESDETDFNIQRLGYWFNYNQKSLFTRVQWLAMKDNPELRGKMFVGIKYGADGTNVALSVAVKTKDNRIYIEGIDCRPIRAGNDWILKWLKGKDIQQIVIDGKSGQDLLSDLIKQKKLSKRKPILPTVKEVVTANLMFEQAMEAKTICHGDQPAMTQIVSNVDHRAIGSGGGFGYKSILAGAEIALLDSAILAHWECSVSKERKIQRTSC